MSQYLEIGCKVRKKLGLELAQFWEHFCRQNHFLRLLVATNQFYDRRGREIGVSIAGNTNSLVLLRRVFKRELKSGGYRTTKNTAAIFPGLPNL
jgi:hypothetical protein